MDNLEAWFENYCMYKEKYAKLLSIDESAIDDLCQEIADDINVPAPIKMTMITLYQNRESMCTLSGFLAQLDPLVNQALNFAGENGIDDGQVWTALNERMTHQLTIAYWDAPNQCWMVTGIPGYVGKMYKEIKELMQRK